MIDLIIVVYLFHAVFNVMSLGDLRVIYLFLLFFNVSLIGSFSKLLYVRVGMPIEKQLKLLLFIERRNIAGFIRIAKCDAQFAAGRWRFIYVTLIPDVLFFFEVFDVGFDGVVFDECVYISLQIRIQMSVHPIEFIADGLIDIIAIFDDCLHVISNGFQTVNILYSVNAFKIVLQ